MDEILDALKKALADFDQELRPLTESKVSQALGTLKELKDNLNPPMEWSAEVTAFDFVEGYGNHYAGWGTYYGPISTWKSNDGTVAEYPNISKVTEQVIQYWSERAKASKHPVLRVRYADLIWDLSEIVTKKPPSYVFARAVVDGVIEIARRNLHENKVSTIKKLERALSLALSLNDMTRIENVRDAIIDYEDSVAQDDKPGLWGFAFDLLMDNDKVNLPVEQKTKLIADLEGHLQRASRLTISGDGDPWLVDASALRLAKYYRKIGRAGDIKRVLNMLGDAFIRASLNASALQASGWLERVYGVLREYGLVDESEKIAIKLRELGTKARAELKSVSQKVEVSSEDMQKYVASLVEGDPDQVFSKIAAHFIPRKDEAEKDLRDLANIAPLQFLMPVELQDASGRPVAKVGSLEDDLVGRVVLHISQTMAMSSMFLRAVLDALIRREPKFGELYLNHLYHSPAFGLERKSIIELGVKAYLNGDHLTSVHVLIPQFENAVRTIFEKAGGSVLKPGRGGSFNLKILDDLLSEQVLLQIFGEDTMLYFKILFTDPRGWNLRNRVCHGLCDPGEFKPSLSDRVVHALLCLAQVREKKPAGK